jgi:adenine-specific DNA-methyltransferase
MIEKLKMQTPDLVDINVKKIAELFPNVISEKKDDSGKTKKAIDFDLLKQILSDVLVDDEGERYRLDWPGKKASLLKANTPINKTLRPVVKDSVDFENTQNLFIEGDNFEVLKILQESYLGKIKMIYIDPPYNTGNDFIYKDNFDLSKMQYEEEIGVNDEDGGKLFKNTDSNGRFHSDWLCMMYERLLVARDLLKDDGVLFISIDEGEVANLKKLCDEIFGEDNFIECITWNKRIPKNDKGVGNIHEYILLYVKDCATKPVFTMRKDGLDDIYDLVDKLKSKNVDFDQAEKEIRQLYKKNAYDRGITLYNSFDKNYRLWGKINMSWPNANTFGPTYDVLHPLTGNPVKIPDRGWRWKKETFDEAAMFVEGKYQNINQLHDGSFLCNKIWFSVNENMQPSSVTYLDDVNTFLLRSILSFKSDGGIEVENLFEGKSFFPYPKPTSLLRVLFSSIKAEDKDIYLDFFAGSATTAHAVMQLNAEDGGSRKFITVQLPEKIEKSSEANKAGYKTIAEIGKERIRRVGKIIRKESKDNEGINKLDIGFRVYKTATSNMKDVYYHPASLQQLTMDDLISNIKEERSPEDLLSQVILDLGLELSLPIEKKEILGNTVYFVQHNSLIACFDDNINFKITNKIAELIPLKVVFKDASFKDDNDRINLEEQFKKLSPKTVITVI